LVKVNFSLSWFFLTLLLLFQFDRSYLIVENLIKWVFFVNF
jgi:hypothetical protein